MLRDLTITGLTIVWGGIIVVTIIAIRRGDSRRRAQQEAAAAERNRRAEIEHAAMLARAERLAATGDFEAIVDHVMALVNPRPLRLREIYRGEIPVIGLISCGCSVSYLTGGEAKVTPCRRHLYMRSAQFARWARQVSSR